MMSCLHASVKHVCNDYVVNYEEDEDKDDEEDNDELFACLSSVRHVVVVLLYVALCWSI